ncbi:MAG: inorganic phosphate transporter [Anaerolineae bacterium]|nr:inorganic phosphate transporter [Anaerolineae bacterium]
MLTVNLIVILALCIVYGYINGLHGSASVVATVVSSRALGPRAALLLAAVGIGLGPFLLGVAVANTLGAELLSPHVASAQVIVAALVGAISWSALTLGLKIPSSISQALIGGLVGAGIAAAGPAGVQFVGLNKVLLALFLSPVLGLFAAYILVRLTYRLAAGAFPAANRWLQRAQVVLSLVVAVAFGANDGQKMIAVMTLGLVATGLLDKFIVPEWVVAVSALTIALGTLVGGRGVIQTLSKGFYKIRPVHGFSAQMASGVIILGAGLFGGPVSGSQVVTSSILGSGSADRIHKVRWGVARQILIGWLLTIPLSGLVSFAVYTALLR